MIPSKKQIRKQIYFKGSMNDQRKLDDNIAQSVFGVSQSHISFIKQTHRNVSHYKEALEDYRAATFSLAICKHYMETSDDALYKEYWKQYTQVVASGQEDYIDRCKEILQFVKYPEGQNLPYTKYNYKQLYELSRYPCTTEYPPFYISYYDIINEFDLKLSKADKQKAVLDYAEQYLECAPYVNGDNNKQLTDRLLPAMRVIAKRIPRQRRQAIREAVSLERPLKQRLNKVSNSFTTLGDKRRKFFHDLFVRGIDPSIEDYVRRDIETINTLYGINLEMPPIKQGGVSHEYHMRVIIREDPKKPRVAYQSNPLQDYIGYPGMDVWAEIFKWCPWIQCGRKREDQTDILLDKHRWQEIRSVYQYNDERGRPSVSGDLSKATENLNMRRCISIATELLVMITGLPKAVVRRFVVLTSWQLFNSGITIEGFETHGVFYPARGQTQGVPNSFHSMTGSLSLATLQACLDAGISEEEAIYSIQNNGDDMTLPLMALEFFKELLEMITGPGVFTREKSFETTINGSLEFCKTIYYANNENLITGYRFSTIYKMITKPENLVHTLDGSFEREKYIFSKFIQEYQDLLDPTIDRMSHFISSAFYEEPSIVTRTIELSYLSQMIAMHQMLLLKNRTIVDPFLLNEAPRDWKHLLHANKSITVHKGTLIYADMKLIRAYVEQMEQSILPQKWDLFLMEEDQYQAAKKSIAYEYGISLDTPILVVRDDSSLTIQEQQVIIDTPTILKVQLELDPSSQIVMEPRIGTNVEVSYDKDHITTKLREQSIEEIELQNNIDLYKRECRAVVSGIPDNLDITNNVVTITSSQTTVSNREIDSRKSIIQRHGHNWSRS